MYRYIERCFPIVPNAVEESEWFDITDRFTPKEQEDKEEQKVIMNTDINKAFDECLELFEEYPKNTKEETKEQPKEAVKKGHKYMSKKKKNKN